MNKKSKSIKKRGVSMRFTLIMFALLPMLLATMIVACLTAKLPVYGAPWKTRLLLSEKLMSLVKSRN